MKRIFLASAALALSAFAAHAADLVCTLNTATGDTMLYNFSPIDSSTLEEHSVMKNGTVMVHSPDRRPRWDVRTAYGETTLIYIPDPRFTVTISGETMTDSKGIRSREAEMFKSGGPFGDGACAWQGPTPRKRSPRPEKF